MSHISTAETFMIGAISGVGYCPICCRKRQIRIGWVEAHCATCNNYFSSETLNRTVKKRRELLNLSVQKMAERLNLKKSTVKYYETHWPSEKYWNNTKKIVLEQP